MTNPKKIVHDMIGKNMAYWTSEKGGEPLKGRNVTTSGYFIEHTEGMEPYGVPRGIASRHKVTERANLPTWGQWAVVQDIPGKREKYQEAGGYDTIKSKYAVAAKLKRKYPGIELSNDEPGIPSLTERVLRRDMIGKSRKIYACSECNFETDSTREAQSHSNKYNYGHNIISNGKTIR